MDRRFGLVVFEDGKAAFQELSEKGYDWVENGDHGESKGYWEEWSEVDFFDKIVEQVLAELLELD